jgi:hypothetical protein
MVAISAPPHAQKLVTEIALAIRTGDMRHVEDELQRLGLGVVLDHRDAGLEPPVAELEKAKDRVRCLVQFMRARNG